MEPQSAGEAAGKLINYGVLGIFAVILLFAVFWLYKQRDKDRKEFEAASKAAEATQRAEVKLLQDKILDLVTKSADQRLAMSDEVAKKYDDAIQKTATKLAEEFTKKLQEATNAYRQDVNDLESRYLQVYADTLNKIHELTNAMGEFTTEARRSPPEVPREIPRERSSSTYSTQERPAIRRNEAQLPPGDPSGRRKG